MQRTNNTPVAEQDTISMIWESSHAPIKHSSPSIPLSAHEFYLPRDYESGEILRSAYHAISTETNKRLIQCIHCNRNSDKRFYASNATRTTRFLYHNSLWSEENEAFKSMTRRARPSRAIVGSLSCFGPGTRRVSAATKFDGFSLRYARSNEESRIF